jgi:hypothetical protein
VGKPVFFKGYPAIVKIKAEFVYRKQRWFSGKDIKLNGGKVYGDYLLAALTNYDERDGEVVE